MQVRYLGIQQLRAFAALAVVAFHATGRIDYSMLWGAGGVDIFFVISGFIMWTVAGAKASPVAFLIARIRRIVPLYWFVTSVMILGAIAGVLPSVKLDLNHIVLSYLFVPHVALKLWSSAPS